MALAAVTATGQTTATAARDPQALSLLGQSLAAMTKGRPIQDIKLQAQVTRIAGSETDTGSAVLQAGAYDKSNINLACSSGQRSEIRNGIGGLWSAASAADDQNHPIAMHNALTAAAWFSPALVIQTWIQDSSFSLSYVGLEDHDGSELQHIRTSRNLPFSGNSDIATELAQLTAMDIYLDSKSLLPVTLEFNTHPDADSRRDLPVQVTFGNYEVSDGLKAPSRIQSLLQNSLLLDLTVTSTSANAGVAPSQFMLP
jgi:hypothetical protein